MFRSARLVALLLLLPLLSIAQADSSHLRISLLTCGVGDEIYTTFGHTAIRVVDSNKHADLAYNYGTFDGFEKNFEIKFMRGKLEYYCSVQSFRSFMEEYEESQRSVQEQVLNFTSAQKDSIYSFLKWNGQEENKRYKYDFLFDNCATRIRDVFPKTYGSAFHFGQTLPKDSKLTFRQIINQYLYKERWERLGIDLLLGAKVDSAMTNNDVMFLPDYLRDGIAGATVSGKPFAEPTKELLPGAAPAATPPNVPLFVLLGVCLLTLPGLSVRKLRILGSIMSTLLLIITGLLGCLMLFMWLGTDHRACQQNWNVLWALPTNLLVPFIGKKGKNRYAVIAIILLLVSLVLHVLHLQEMPLTEIWPLLLAMLGIYGMIYRRATTGKQP